MKFAFWVSLAGVLYAYVGYPLAIWALTRIRPRAWKVAPIDPSVSVVMAVHNGIERLPDKVEHLLSLDYRGIKEIIIVSDGSTDGTAEFLGDIQSRRIKTVVLREQQGKSAAINAGVALATGEIILFVDIRPEIAPGAIQQMVNNFADESVGCVAGELILRNDGHDATAQAVGGLYWKFEQWIRNCEAAFDSPVGVYGGFYAIRRRLFVPLPAGLILDDMYQPLSIIRQGYRSVLDRNAVVFDTWPKKVEGEFQRKVRTLAGNFQLFRVAPWTLSPRNRVLFQLASHKVMRLIVPYLLILLFISSVFLSANSTFFAAAVLVQAFGWVLALAGLRIKLPGLERVAAPAGAMLVLNVAAVVGLYKFLFTRGPLWKIWNANGRKASDIKNKSLEDSNHGREHGPSMTYKKSVLFIAFLGLCGFIGFVIHHHVVGVRAARVDHAVPLTPYFPTGSIWTQDVSHDPVDPQSTAIINWLSNAGGWGLGKVQVDFDIRVVQANAATPLVPFHKGDQFISPDSDSVKSIPLPPGGGTEGESGYECNISDNDCHLIVADRSQGKLYEAYQATYLKNELYANFLAVWDLNRVYPPSGRGEQCSSADAAGLPIAPLLFNADELAAGGINHALRFILPNARIRAGVFVSPATHAGGPKAPSPAPPMGVRFRLKSSYDVSRLNPAAQVVARALQKYGMFLADGGNIVLTAQNDADTQAKYASVGFGPHDLQDLKVADFEVVDMGKPIPLTYDCSRNR